MWLHACRHNGLAIYRELRTPLIRSERFDEFFHNPLANIRFLELDNERGSNCSTIEQFYNVFSTVGSPCRSNRLPLDVCESGVAHYQFNLARFRQFEHRGQIGRADIHVCKCRNSLQDYFEQIAAAFGPIPKGDGIAPTTLQNTISFADSLRWIGQAEQTEAASRCIKADITRAKNPTTYATGTCQP